MNRRRFLQRVIAIYLMTQYNVDSNNLIPTVNLNDVMLTMEMNKNYGTE